MFRRIGVYVQPHATTQVRSTQSNELCLVDLDCLIIVVYTQIWFNWERYRIRATTSKISNPLNNIYYFMYVTMAIQVQQNQKGQ